MAPATDETTTDARTVLEKRRSTIRYLRRANEGSTHYFNTVLLERTSLDSALATGKIGGQPPRTGRLALLGASLATLSDVPSSGDFLRSLLALVTEFDALAEDATVRSRSVRARRTAHLNRQRILLRPNRSAPRRSGATETLLGAQDAGETSYLLTFNILDYFQTLFSLCDVLVDVYTRLLNCIGPQAGSDTGSRASTASSTSPPPATSSASADLALKADAKLKKVLAPITRELDTLARASISSELNDLYLAL